MKMTTTTSCLSLTTVESTASESLISATTLASKSNSKPSESILTPEWESEFGEFAIDIKDGKHDEL